MKPTKGFVDLKPDNKDHRPSEADRDQVISNLQATLEATVDGIIVVGLGGEIKAFSNRFKKIWNIPDLILNSKDASQALTYVLARLDHPEVFSQKVRSVFNVSDTNTLDVLHLKDGRVLESYSRPQKLKNRIIGRVWGFRDITEHNRIEKALKESEEKYKAILKRIEDGFYEFDIAGNLTFFNDAMCEMLGYSKSELLGMNNRKYMDENNSKKVFKAFNQVYKTGRPYKAFDWELIRKDGQRRYVETSVSLINNSKVQPTGFQGIARDITERKHAEAANTKERDFISNVLYWIDSLVVVIDMGGFIVSFNRASEQLSGYRFEEVQDRPFWDILLAPDEREGVETTIKDVAHKKLPKDFQNHWVTKAGHKRLIRWHNSVLRKPDGSIDHILCTGLDITERHEAEKALRESEAKYRELVQNANSIIARFDTDGKITFFNEYAEKFFGYSGEEIIGKNAVGTILPETETSGRDLSSLLSNIARNPEQYTTYENENMLRNGQRVWVAWTNKAIYSPEGKLAEILCIGNDITKRKQVEEQIKTGERSFFLFLIVLMK